MSSFVAQRDSEDDDVCCYFCIPMKVGIKVLSGFNVFLSLIALFFQLPAFNTLINEEEKAT